MQGGETLPKPYANVLETAEGLKLQNKKKCTLRFNGRNPKPQKECIYYEPFVKASGGEAKAPHSEAALDPNMSLE